MDSKFLLSFKVRFSDCKEAAAKTAEATVLEMLLKMEAGAVEATAETPPKLAFVADDSFCGCFASA